MVFTSVKEQTQKKRSTLFKKLRKLFSGSHREEEEDSGVSGGQLTLVPSSEYLVRQPIVTEMLKSQFVSSPPNSVSFVINNQNTLLHSNEEPPFQTIVDIQYPQHYNEEVKPVTTATTSGVTTRSATREPIHLYFSEDHNARQLLEKRVPVTLAVDNLEIRHLHIPERAIQDIIDKIVAATSFEERKKREIEREEHLLEQLSGADMERRLVHEQRKRLEQAKKVEELKIKKREELAHQLPPPIRTTPTQSPIKTDNTKNVNSDFPLFEKIKSPISTPTTVNKSCFKRAVLKDPTRELP